LPVVGKTSGGDAHRQPATGNRQPATKELTLPNKHRRLASTACATGIALAALFFTGAWSSAETNSNDSARSHGVLPARLLATGIPGAGAVAEVGDFLRGSPIHDNPALAAFAQPGQVLDP